MPSEHGTSNHGQEKQSWYGSPLSGCSWHCGAHTAEPQSATRGQLLVSNTCRFLRHVVFDRIATKHIHEHARCSLTDSYLDIYFAGSQNKNSHANGSKWLRRNELWLNRDGALYSTARPRQHHTQQDSARNAMHRELHTLCLTGSG